MWAKRTDCGRIVPITKNSLLKIQWAVTLSGGLSWPNAKLLPCSRQPRFHCSTVYNSRRTRPASICVAQVFPKPEPSPKPREDQTRGTSRRLKTTFSKEPGSRRRCSSAETTVSVNLELRSASGPSAWDLHGADTYQITPHDCTEEILEFHAVCSSNWVHRSIDVVRQ